MNFTKKTLIATEKKINDIPQELRNILIVMGAEYKNEGLTDDIGYRYPHDTHIGERYWINQEAAENWISIVEAVYSDYKFVYLILDI